MATGKARRNHQWLKDRNMSSAFVVLRIDDALLEPIPRGCFPSGEGEFVVRNGNTRPNFWGTLEEALSAATWATNKFGNQYGVFEIQYIVEPTDRARVTRV